MKLRTPHPSKKLFGIIGLAGIIPIGVLAYFLAHGVGLLSTQVSTGAATTLPVTVTSQLIAGAALTLGGTGDTISLNVNNANSQQVAFVFTPTVKHNPFTLTSVASGNAAATAMPSSCSPDSPSR
jgi:hypothetical protein